MWKQVVLMIDSRAQNYKTCFLNTHGVLKYLNSLMARPTGTTDYWCCMFDNEAALSSCFLSLGSSSVVIGVFVVFDTGWVDLGQSRVGLSISAIVMGC